MKERVADSDKVALGPLHADCPGREVFDHIASRWGLLILIALSQGPLRFYQLRDSIGGISEKMLSQTLKTLSRDGLINRTVDTSVPPKVTYELTRVGREAAEPVIGLVAWLGRRMPDILKAQRKFDQVSR